MDKNTIIEKGELGGECNNTRFVKPVWNVLWGIPLKYAKWCIQIRFLILNK